MRAPTIDDARRLLAMPRRDAVRFVSHSLREQARRRRRGRGVRGSSTHGRSAAWVRSLIGPLSPAALSALDPAVFAALGALALDHRFDVLGSGWVHAVHGRPCAGLEGHSYAAARVVADRRGAWLAGRVNAANLGESQRLWRLVDDGYEPVDWHRDARSGYRWHEGAWHGAVAYGRARGADVKVPWELARMHHLPQLALAAALAGAGAQGMLAPGDYARETRNQVLDFLASNPPGFGVNWCSPMDVAIRMVNWLVAHDLFVAHGAAFDDEFETAFAGAVEAHASHVVDNLEWTPVVRSNHYLSNVAGVAFAAAYLESPRAAGRLEMAARELTAEVAAQFNDDGSNFEGSTSYHRLSCELAVYGTAAAVRAGASFPPSHASRLRSAAEFTRWLTRPDGRVVQIGDNDSGRLLKLRPCVTLLTAAQARARYASLEGYEGLDGDDVWPDADDLVHAHLVSAIGGLTGDAALVADAGDGGFEAAVVTALAGRTLAPGVEAAPVTAGAPGGQPGGPPSDVVRFDAPGADLRAGLERRAFPDFGVYVYRSPRLYLAIRCGPLHCAGSGGHAHNDQLSLELVIDGRTLLRDPGTYVYTPLRDRRNAYRSVLAHSAPVCGKLEPGRLDLGTFALPDPLGECIAFTEDVFVGRHAGYPSPVTRSVTVEAAAVVVRDWGDGVRFHRPRIAFSPGYGRLLAEDDA